MYIALSVNLNLVLFQMNVVSAYFGILLLVYCSFRLVDGSCSDCTTAYYRCFGICKDPNQCTICSQEKEKCEIQHNCASGKRSSEGWKPKAHQKPVFIQDQNDDLPLGHDQDQTLKYLLREILRKREKNSQHWRPENSEFIYFRYMFMTGKCN